MNSRITRQASIGLLVWAVAISLLTFAASRLPYFPSDLAVAQAVQRWAPIPVPVAITITASAGQPWSSVLLALTVASAWIISGWRSALLAVPIFFGLLVFGMWLSPHVAQPRPSPELIAVVGHPKGYGFPSIFGLVYGATFGYIGVLSAVRLRGGPRIAIPVLAALALIAGACCRIVLGAHWPSDLWTAYLIALFWIALLMPAAQRDSAV